MKWTASCSYCSKLMTSDQTSHLANSTAVTSSNNYHSQSLTNRRLGTHHHHPNYYSNTMNPGAVDSSLAFNPVSTAKTTIIANTHEHDALIDDLKKKLAEIEVDNSLLKKQLKDNEILISE